VILKTRPPVPKADTGLARNCLVFNAFCFKQMARICWNMLNRLRNGGFRQLRFYLHQAPGLGSPPLRLNWRTSINASAGVRPTFNRICRHESIIALSPTAPSISIVHETETGPITPIFRENPALPNFFSFDAKAEPTIYEIVGSACHWAADRDRDESRQNCAIDFDGARLSQGWNRESPSRRSLPRDWWRLP